MKNIHYFLLKVINLIIISSVDMKKKILWGLFFSFVFLLNSVVIYFIFHLLNPNHILKDINEYQGDEKIVKEYNKIWNNGFEIAKLLALSTDEKEKAFLQNNFEENTRIYTTYSLLLSTQKENFRSQFFFEDKNNPKVFELEMNYYLVAWFVILVVLTFLYASIRLKDIIFWIASLVVSVVWLWAVYKTLTPISFQEQLNILLQNKKEACNQEKRYVEKIECYTNINTISYFEGIHNYIQNQKTVPFFYFSQEEIDAKKRP